QTCALPISAKIHLECPIMINSRSKTILRELMSVKTPLTGAYLANLNKVTPRTTREDIKMLDDLLRMHGARISSLMGRGYQLEVLDDQKFRSKSSRDRKSTRLNSSHVKISYAVLCLKKKNNRSGKLPD